MTLEELANNMTQARKAFDRATAEYHTALRAAHPFQRGDIIRASDGTEALVDAVFVQCNSVRMRAVLRKKDGSWGQRQAPLWRVEWSKPEKIGREEMPQ